MPTEKQLQVKNKKRRAALVLGATGIAAFFVGKLFGGSGLREIDVKNDHRFQNFRITEDNNEMIFSSENGDPIVIIDKKSFTE